MGERESFAQQVLGLVSPYSSGIELEVTLSLIEVFWGVAVLIIPITSMTPQAFFIGPYMGIGRFSAMLWLLAGGLSMFGMLAFFRGHQICAHLRWGGGLVSAMLWIWSAIETFNVGGPVLVGIIAGVFSVVDIRIMAGAWHRFLG